MAITFACPKCGKPYKVHDQFAGKHARCKSCQADMTVPGAASAESGSSNLVASDLAEAAAATRKCPKCGSIIAVNETVCPRCRALVTQLEEAADWTAPAAPAAPRAAYQPQEDRPQSTRCPQCGTWIAPTASGIPRCLNCNYQPGAAAAPSQQPARAQAVALPKPRTQWANGFWTREFYTPANFVVLAALALLVVGESAPVTARSLAYVCTGMAIILGLAYNFWFAFEIQDNLTWLGPIRSLPIIMQVVYLILIGVELAVLIGGASLMDIAKSPITGVVSCILAIPGLISAVVIIIGVVKLFPTFLACMLGAVRCLIIYLMAGSLLFAAVKYNTQPAHSTAFTSGIVNNDTPASPAPIQTPVNVVAPGAPAAPETPAPSNATAGPVFPDRPPLAPLAPGIQRTIVRMTGTGPGSQMQMYLYEPEGAHEPASLPCILIAPAGTSGLTGATLSPGDEPEHTPYVLAGYAVLAYELDGATFPNAPARQLIKAIQDFRSAAAGMTNAHLALEYVLAKVPEVNPHLIFAAGHSSAGMVALNFAAHDHRLRGVIAYAPATDIPKFQSPVFLSNLDRALPGAADFARDASPITHVNDIQCPAFIFHADDDGIVSNAQLTPFVTALQAKNTQVKFARVATGNHHDSMINQGIPMAIAWLQPMTHAVSISDTLAALNALDHMQPTPTGAGITTPAPATPPTPPPAVPEAITHYTVAGPAGFKEDDNPPDHGRQWTRTRPGRSVSSTFTVTARYLTDPNVAADPPLPNDPTFIAGPLTFHLVGSAGNGVVKSVRWQAVDKTCLIEIKAAWDQFDVDAESAMTNACKKISPAKVPAPPAPATPPA